MTIFHSCFFLECVRFFVCFFSFRAILSFDLAHSALYYAFVIGPSALLPVYFRRLYFFLIQFVVRWNMPVLLKLQFFYPFRALILKV